MGSKKAKGQRSTVEMSMEMIFYMGIVLFLVSLLGLLISVHALPYFISLQIMAAAAVINLLNFSLHSAPGNGEIKVFLVLGFMAFYLLQFSLAFYIYANQKKTSMPAAVRLLSLEKSDWWGEDKI
jgi:NADH:ubiquinone oxidoreductase subunit K